MIDIISYASQKKVKTMIVTNGSLLTEKMISQLLDSGLAGIYISYFNSTPKMFSTRRAKNISYEEYDRRVKQFVKKKLQSKCNIEISIGVMYTKYCIFKNIKELENESGARKCIAEWLKFVSQWTTPQMNINNLKDISDFREGSSYQITDGLNIAFKEVGTWGNQLLIREGVRIKKSNIGSCRNPFETLFVAWDGRCSCCCLDYDCKIFVGDANKNSIAEIWNGHRISEITRLFQLDAFQLSEKSG